MAGRRPDPDPIITARLAGTAARHGITSDPADYQAALAALRAIAGDRPDLLAEQAGLTWGYYRQRALPEVWPQHERAAVLLLDAGADLEAVPRWFEEGRARATRQSGSPPW
jgi:hypothetical protein